MSRRVRVVGDVLLAGAGLALFVYGDLSSNRVVRLAAVFVLTVALVFGLVLGAHRDTE